CYQCVKCTSGCPLNEYFDWQPNQIMRALQLGQEQIALQSQTPWLCASCQTCTTRCPQDLDIAGIMEYLTRLSVERGFEPQVPPVDDFNQAFLREVHLWGRSYEPGVMAEFKLRNLQTLFDDLDMYLEFLKKGKVGFLPKAARLPSKHKVERIPGAAEAVAYYPGCSLESTAKEFDHSSRAVCQALDLPLIEPRGWVCCGSSPAHKVDPAYALRMPMENLALIEQAGFTEVTMPCAACYNRHKAAQHEIRHDPAQRAAVEDEMHYTYQDKVSVSTLIEAIYRHIGPERVRGRVTRPLDDLKVAAYYGCLLTRPPEVTGAEHPENPTDMDELLAALGAEVRDWSYKTTCCGASHSLSRPDIVIDLSRKLVVQARQAGAEAIAVACPLCHMNLDARQMHMGLDERETLPILYFTQLMGLALGLPIKTLGLHKHLVDPRPLLRQKGFLND
ncbi:MAG: 4Fe-4S dicluster domain-containing protein, partial [Anaerolineales bacterium]|nr:4Fe-4S dicluster domain-containing protein [Anaerolineales bacterium]